MHQPGDVMVADIGTKPLKSKRFTELTPMLGMGYMMDTAEEYMKYGYEGRAEPVVELDSDGEEPWFPERHPTPPTDEEMVQVRSLSFKEDVEKVHKLVQLITILQSVEGVSAKLAEGDEQKTYKHMIGYGVFMAMLGAAV